MTVEWLENPASQARDSASLLRDMLRSGRTIAAVGAHDGISAALAKRAGFEALYLSGAALSASMALPDLGILTLDDVRRAASQVVRGSGLPLIVDCDTGFGEVLNVMQTVRDLETVGAACIQIEDQQFPKKCGHLSGKRLVTADEMCRKVTAAKRAARSLVVCARTDAAAVSLDEAIDRANRYAEAGADLIFVEALDSPDAIRRVREEVSAPLLANMTEFGRTPHTTLKEWSEYGYEVAIFPVSAFRVAAGAMDRFYARLRADGHVGAFLPQMMTRSELYDVIQYHEYEALDSAIARSTLPDATARALESGHETP